VQNIITTSVFRCITSLQDVCFILLKQMKRELVIESDLTTTTHVWPRFKEGKGDFLLLFLCFGGTRVLNSWPHTC
jgi:hypothetical protein